MEIFPRELQGGVQCSFFQNNIQERYRQCGCIIMFEEKTPTFIEGKTHRKNQQDATVK